MPDNPFDGPRSVLSRAEEHIDDLNTRGKAFAEKKPYTTFCELDIPTAQYFYGFRLTESPPDVWSTIAKDALTNLRDALDLAVCATIRVLDPLITADGLEGVCFPFASKEDHFAGALKRGCEKVDPNIRSLISSFKPYPGGNDPLYLLKTLAQTNRHRIVQPVLFAAENSVGVHFLGGTDFSVGPFGWDRAKNKFIIIKAGNPNVKYDFTIALHIAFGNVEIVGGQPAVPILYDFCREVARIIMTLEAESYRLKARP